MSQHIYNLVREKEHENQPRHPRFAATQLPPVVDLRPKCPPVFDQGQLGSCTANAGVVARMMLTGITDELSRLFLYYNERTDKKNDTGAEMRDICVSLHNQGVCLEKFDPYDISKFTKKPSAAAYKDALTRRIKSFATFDGDTVDDVQQIKAYLATVGLPVLIGMDVYQSFESQAVAASGNVPMPAASEQLLGGHAVLIVGYDDSRQVLIVRNSWGAAWGDKGYFYLPYQYVEKKLAYDTWTLTA